MTQRLVTSHRYELCDPYTLEPSSLDQTLPTITIVQYIWFIEHRLYA